MTDPLMISACCPLDSVAVAPVVRCAGRWLCEVKPQTEVADVVVDFIRRRFELAYGARPALRIPELLALTTAQGSILAAVGVRNAAAEALFLEDYLDRPVQHQLPCPNGDRRQIAEFAHLAGVEAGVSRVLFASLAVWLDSANYRWVVCTGTDQLRNSFRRLGIKTHVLAKADPGRLAGGGAGWGRYYDHNPAVLAIDVAAAIHDLREAGMLRRTRVVADTVAAPEISAGGRYGHIA